MTAIDTRASTIVSLYTTAIYQYYSPPIIAVLTTSVHRLSNLSTNRYRILHDTRSTGTDGPSHVLAADDRKMTGTMTGMMTGMMTEMMTGMMTRMMPGMMMGMMTATMTEMSFLSLANDLLMMLLVSLLTHAW